MPGSPEDRLRLAAVISALKAAGVRVKNWKNLLNGESTDGDTCKRERRCRFFAFGRDLSLLPQSHLPEMGGTVPSFLVDACEFLSQHLHTEGLFRKTGSLSRIRALRAGLEQGEPVFSPPLSSSLQPCDMASLLKQFLRELPSPLIPSELQGVLCRAQGLGPEGGQEGGRDGATLLVTALFPPSHARTLRYLCTFLRSAAQRCRENRMEVGSLALVIAPNLLQVPTCKLSMGTERLMDRQATVITALITYADRIGVVPSVIMETLSSGAPTSVEGSGFQEKAGLGVYRSLRRQRRRSVGEMFVDAFSKLKTSRTPNGPSHPSDGTLGQQVAVSPTCQSPVTVKRKASEDTLPEVEGSAKKRRSVHDLRDDNQPTSLPCSDESKSTVGQSQSPTPSLCSIISGEKGCKDWDPPAPQLTSGKKRNHRRGTKRVQRLPAPEDQAQRRRRSLRFFAVTSWSDPSTAPLDGVQADNWLSSTNRITDNPGEPSGCEGGGPFQTPVILIEDPRGVVVGREVEENPDILNCSFVSNLHGISAPDILAAPSGRIWSATKLKGTGALGGVTNKAGDGRAQGGGATVWSEAGIKGPVVGREAGLQEQGVGREGTVGPEEECPVIDVFWRVSRGYRPPRRSISLPEVISEQVGGQGEEKEDEGDGEGGEFVDSDFHRCTWPLQEHVEEGNEKAWNGMGSEKESVRGREKEEGEKDEKWQDRCKETERKMKEKREEKRRAVRDGGEKKKKKEEESGLGFTRSHQRMSVADRVRRFNVLAAWLRAPRAPPVPPALQRGPVRLRRQGARRFGRSMSHEGVAGFLQEQGAPKPQPDDQDLLKHRKLSNLSPNPSFSTNHLNHPNLLNRPSPLNPTNPPNPISKQSKPQHHHLSQQLSQNAAEDQHSHHQGLKEPQPPHEPERPPHRPVLQRERESRLREPDLHELLDLQLRICHPQPEQEPPASQNALCLTPPPLQQGLSESAGSSCHLTPPAPPHLHTDTRPYGVPAACLPTLIHSAHTQPPSDSAPCHLLEAASCIDPPPMKDTGIDCAPRLCGIDRSETGAGGADAQPHLPPLALQFRVPVIRRRYRDSPRWPIPEIHITSLTPFQL